MDFPTPNQSRDIEVHTLPDPENYESSYNLLAQWDPGDNPLQPPLFSKENTSELTAKTEGSDRISAKKYCFYP